MKRLVTVLSLCVLAACSKNDVSNTNQTTTTQEQPTTCLFGQNSFNLTKRAALNEQPLKNPHNSGGGSGSGGGGTPPPPPPPPSSGVIYLDFDGQVVSGTNWNAGATINCAPANLTTVAMTNILYRVMNDYAPFNVTVTTDEAVYNAAPAALRMRVIVTESWEWFGQAGGTSFRGSFTWGNNTPCFVFSSLLNYNEKNIAEAASHEAGHTFGLRHQATYNGTVMTSGYNNGIGSGETSWAPIMGCGYYRNLTVWHNGPSDVSSTSYQDEVPIITSVLGVRSDDYSNTTTGAAALTTSLGGFINNSTDVDFFSVNLSAGKTISAIPYNLGAGNDGANLDIILRVYNAQGQLISTVEDPNLLSATTYLAAGQYFVSVSTTTNVNATRYGMLGQYSISLN
jgi:hypothetical protein